MAGGQRAFITHVVFEHMQQKNEETRRAFAERYNKGFSLFPKSPLRKPCGDLIVTSLELHFGVGITSGIMSEQLWFVKPWV